MTPSAGSSDLRDGHQMNIGTPMDKERRIIDAEPGRTRTFRFGPPLILGLAIFFACLFGVYTRPVGFLANFWPANAIMLGLLIRMPRSATAAGWVASAAAYMAVDLLTGSSLVKGSILNGANLVGVAAGYFVFLQLPAGAARLQDPASMLQLVLAAAAGGLAAGIVGGAANPILFGGGVASGFMFWFATEFVNYLTVLPVILAFPSLGGAGVARITSGRLFRKPDLAPMTAFALACIAGVWIGGPGAIVFPVPALLWCGLVYPVFATTLFTLLFGVWTLVVVSTGYVPGPVEHYDEMTLISIRLGASLVALAPVMLASVMRSHRALLADLERLASRDPLTGVENRRAFRELAAGVLASAGRSCAVMMIDLDHFKAVNDRYGHAGGDEVLIAFTRRARECLRPGDLIGRLGGEEFAVLARDCSSSEAWRIAERVRLAVSRPLTVRDGREVRTTASIGAVFVPQGAGVSVDALLAEADALLYRAKEAGRDRVVCGSFSPRPASPGGPADASGPTPLVS
ncbi:diguanylate cyclase [Methylopila henanensis]|uniref:diguanylate cyclase n=1 Tax=Methylopila henanensis TaxID=873516 RepID=A0ABW4K8Y6_9HYPH